MAVFVNCVESYLIRMGGSSKYKPYSVGLFESYYSEIKWRILWAPGVGEFVRCQNSANFELDYQPTVFV